MRISRVLLTSTAAAIAAGLLATPALAAPGDTSTSFTVSGDGLSISVPAGPVSLGTGTPGSSITGQLGTVSVADNRALQTPTWTAGVISSDFETDDGVGAGETVPAGSVTYASGAVDEGTSDGTCTGSTASALDNTTAKTAASYAGGSGNNTCSWDPTLVVTVAQSNVAGLYVGTVNHSVA